MKLSEVPFNMDYEIGPDLRERPILLCDFQKGIGFLEGKIKALMPPLELAPCLSLAGVCNRILGNLNRSLDQLIQARVIYKMKPTAKAYLINEIRIAQTLQFLGKHLLAEKKYSEVEKVVMENESFASLLDFIYQHKGKNYFEMAEQQKAIASIRKALEIRQKKGDEKLMASSEFALERITAHKLSHK